jgi:hypothetical protein
MQTTVPKSLRNSQEKEEGTKHFLHYMHLDV